MHINDDHMFHGAALTQIAEHPSFTAINTFGSGQHRSRSAFRINDDTGVFIKYASAPSNAHNEYTFNFSAAHLNELADLAKRCSRVTVALVCAQDREICGLSLDDLNGHIARRRKAAGHPETQYTVLVTAPKGKGLRVYMNQPGKKNLLLGEQIVPRKSFPGLLFE